MGRATRLVAPMNAHGLIQTARGMCTDERPYPEIDAMLSEALDVVYELEALREAIDGPLGVHAWLASPQPERNRLAGIQRAVATAKRRTNGS